MRIRVVVAALVALLVGAPARAANYTDWWWGGSALTGQGLNVGQHGSMIFASWFAYDESGRGMWVVFSGPLNAAGNSGFTRVGAGGTEFTWAIMISNWLFCGNGFWPVTASYNTTPSE